MMYTQEQVDALTAQAEDVTDRVVETERLMKTAEYNKNVAAKVLDAMFAQTADDFGPDELRDPEAEAAAIEQMCRDNHPSLTVWERNR